MLGLHMCAHIGPVLTFSQAWAIRTARKAEQHARRSSMQGAQGVHLGAWQSWGAVRLEASRAWGQGRKACP